MEERRRRQRRLRHQIINGFVDSIIFFFIIIISTVDKEDKRQMLSSKSFKVHPFCGPCFSVVCCKCSSKSPVSTRSCTTVPPSFKWLDSTTHPKPFGCQLWWLLSISFAHFSASIWWRRWADVVSLSDPFWASFCHWPSSLSDS